MSFPVTAVFDDLKLCCVVYKTELSPRECMILLFSCKLLSWCYTVSLLNVDGLNKDHSLLALIPSKWLSAKMRLFPVRKNGSVRENEKIFKL